MNDVEKTIIRSMAINNMNISQVAKDVGYSRQQIIRYIQKIDDESGLDCKNFYDLIELLKMIGVVI